MTIIKKYTGRRYGIVYNVNEIMKRETCHMTEFFTLNNYIKDDKDSYCFPETFCIDYQGKELCELINKYYGHDKWQDIQMKTLLEIIMNLPEMKDIIPVFGGDKGLLTYRKFTKEYIIHNGDRPWSIIFGDMKKAIPYKDTTIGKKNLAKENERKANNKMVNLIAGDVLKDLSRRYGLKEAAKGYYLTDDGFNTLVEEALTEKIINSLAEYGIIINRTNKKPRAWNTILYTSGLDLKTTE